MRSFLKRTAVLGVSLAAVGAFAFSAARDRAPDAAFASSHREAPAISQDPSVDLTDVYMWVAPDATDSVTFAMNTWPFANPSGGPNFYFFATDAVYRLNIDNNGDAVADVMFDFTFRTEIRNLDTFLYNTGVVESLTDPDLNVRQFYTITKQVPTTIGGPMTSTVVARDLQVAPAYVGTKSMPNYPALANAAINNVPGGGKVFAGQRDDPFFIDLGGVFDLLSIRPALPGNASNGPDGLAGYNVNSIIAQLPMSSLVGSSGPIIGAWATTLRGTASTEAGVTTITNLRQVSRLGAPLVNEAVLPLRLKDAFNSIPPTQDAVALPFVRDPEIPKLLTALYNLNVPPAPRNDLITIYLTGIPDLNQPPGVTPAEMPRLNMSIPPSANPNRLGLLGGDNSGFPNGRRPADDVHDISLRALAGATPFTPTFNVAPNNQLGDNVPANDVPFLTSFPYIATPHAGTEPAGLRIFTPPTAP